MTDSGERESGGKLLARWATERVGELVFTTSFGAEDQVVTDMICRGGLGIEMATIDTGRLYPETYEVWVATEKHYGIRVRAYTPRHEALEELVNERGIALYRESVEARRACCAVRKLEPLERLLRGKKVWVTGLRAEQSPTRRELQAVEEDAERGVTKVNPLFDWSERDVWDYIRAWGVPYNRLHDVGYPSIGCACCTRAVKRTESIRAGRWWWEAPEQKECGLHHRPRN